MEIIIAIFSILLIAFAVWLIDKIFGIKMCPICAGVATTWIWILAFTDWQLVAAILMGGTVVGIAYQSEKYLSGQKNSLLWKILFIPAGFAGAYFLLSKNIINFIFMAVLILILSIIFFRKRNLATSNSKVEELKKQMEKCC